jgi:N-acetylmuramoyl-L-alanine amidase
MKALLPLILFCWQAALGATAPNPARLPATPIANRGYVSLNDWAKLAGFDFGWSRTTGEISLSRRGLRLEFKADSRRGTINDVLFHLSLPVRHQNGASLISLLDLRTAVYPVLYPTAVPARVRTICVDAGHGGKDPGNSDGARLEKTYTLLLAQELRQQLKSAGFRVVMTRDSDQFIELEERPLIARRARADVLVSLHFNSTAGNNPASGAEVFCLTPAGANSTNETDQNAGHHQGPYPGNRFDAQNMLLAYQVQKFLVREYKSEDRGVRRQRLSVLRGAEMPTVLIEGGFMSSPVESRRIYHPRQREKMARAITDALQNYKRLVER